jgi:hypothetical protein
MQAVQEQILQTIDDEARERRELLCIHFVLPSAREKKIDRFCFLNRPPS